MSRSLYAESQRASEGLRAYTNNLDTRTALFFVQYLGNIGIPPKTVTEMLQMHAMDRFLSLLGRKKRFVSPQQKVLGISLDAYKLLQRNSKYKTDRIPTSEYTRFPMELLKEMTNGGELSKRFTGLKDSGDYAVVREALLREAELGGGFSSAVTKKNTQANPRRGGSAKHMKTLDPSEDSIVFFLGNPKEISTFVQLKRGSNGIGFSLAMGMMEQDKIVSCESIFGESDRSTRRAVEQAAGKVGKFIETNVQPDLKDVVVDLRLGYSSF